METPTQHLHQLAVLVLDATNQPDNYYAAFQDRIRERFHLIEPLHRRLQRRPLGAPLWVDDPGMHLESHLHHLVLTEGGGLPALAREAGIIASRPLPRDRPLWEAWFLEGIAPHRNGVIVKIHHAALDGVSGIASLVAFFDLEPFPTTATAWPTWEPTPLPSAGEVRRDALSRLRDRPGTMLRSIRRLRATSREFAGATSSSLPLPMRGPRVSFNGPLTPRRSVAFTSISLDEVKELRRVFGVTVNDVTTALVTGVVRAYLSSRQELPDSPLVAGVPISERKPEHGMAGNHFSMMFYALPVHIADAAERLLAVHRSATEAKDLYARAGVGLIADVATLAPFRVAQLGTRLARHPRVAKAMRPVANIGISNIRGPEVPFYSGGARLEKMFPMGPLFEGQGLSVTTVSYLDHVAFGFITCPDLVADVQGLADGVHVELERLGEAAGRLQAGSTLS